MTRSTTTSGTTLTALALLAGALACFVAAGLAYRSSALPRLEVAAAAMLIAAAGFLAETLLTLSAETLRQSAARFAEQPHRAACSSVPPRD